MRTDAPKPDASNPIWKQALVLVGVIGVGLGGFMLYERLIAEIDEHMSEPPPISTGTGVGVTLDDLRKQDKSRTFERLGLTPQGDR
ncbi:hypothetical protein [Geopseudomonas aromaticivorans]